MTLDLDAFSPAARARQIKVGQSFGSQDTLNQANRTLAAFGDYGAQVTSFGFNAKDAQQLKDARDMLVAAGVDRESSRGKKKVTSQALTGALKQGQQARLRARAILHGVLEDLEDLGAADAERTVTTALQQTAATPDTAERLAAQLERLAQTMTADGIAAVAAERGGPDAVTVLGQAAAGLRSADQNNAVGRGTPAETQRLDQIDGIIVRLARRARKAAVVAGRELGNPALAQAFRLDQLYRSRGGTAPAEDSEDDIEPGDEDTEG